MKCASCTSHHSITLINNTSGWTQCTDFAGDGGTASKIFRHRQLYCQMFELMCIVTKWVAGVGYPPITVDDLSINEAI
eukprot:scaffold325289_cov42-Prasinocladus_malaysianus.AAC.1